MHRLLLASLIVALVPTLARGDRCSELATPATFDAASAMRAIFCEYDAERRATLLPPRFTEGEEEGKVVPAREVTCYARTGAKYETVATEQCGPARKPAPPKNAPAPAEGAGKR